MAKATPAAEQLLRHSNEPKDAKDTDLKLRCVCLPSVALNQVSAWDTTIGSVNQTDQHGETLKPQNATGFNINTSHLKTSQLKQFTTKAAYLTENYPTQKR